MQECSRIPCSQVPGMVGMLLYVCYKDSKPLHRHAKGSYRTGPARGTARPGQSIHAFSSPARPTLIAPHPRRTK